MLRLRDEVRSAPLAASLSMTNVAARRAKALSCWSGARGPRSGPLAEAKYPYLTQGVRHERAPPESSSVSPCPPGYISIRPPAPILFVEVEASAELALSVAVDVQGPS